jgi:uncharacterized membrane protein
MRSLLTVHRPDPSASSRRAAGATRSGERGAVTFLIVLVLLIVVVGVGVVTTTTRVVLDRARAQGAADAAALAGAVADDATARDLAQRDGAVLRSIRHDGADVVVEVRLGSASARARAREVDPGG